VKVLRERNYASLVRTSTAYSTWLEVDEFLGRTLPELLESEFTAAMEGALDDVAAGKQNWENTYLTGIRLTLLQRSQPHINL
jgi:DNA topoisomerase-1